MRRLWRALAVAMLLAMLTGPVETAKAAPFWPGITTNGLCAPSAYYPSLIQCRDGGIFWTDLPALYTSPQVLISVASGGSAGIYVKCNDQGGQSTMLISNDGDWTITCPTQSGANVVDLEFDCPNGGTFTITNVSYASGGTVAIPTNTPNPSDTATATIGPGTPLPTFTPLPTGHVTYTPTSSPTVTPTGSPTPTPAPVSRDCGLGFQNCDMLSATYYYSVPGGSNGYWDLSPCPTHWSYFAGNGCSAGTLNVNLGSNCGQWGSGWPSGTVPGITCSANGGSGGAYIELSQGVTLPGSGYVCIDYTMGTNTLYGLNNQHWYLAYNGGNLINNGAAIASGEHVSCVGPFSSGAAFSFDIGSSAANAGYAVNLTLNQFYLSASPSGGSTTPTPTITPDATPTITRTPTATVPPLPFDTESPVPSPTSCPGGCVKGMATAIPIAVDTVIGIDTSPISPLEGLTLTRSACTKFFDVPIVEPQVHGTPIFGSSQPLSITWTTPATGTAFQPCADSNFSSTWWDITWHVSVVLAGIAFLAWLVRWARNLFT